MTRTRSWRDLRWIASATVLFAAVACQSTPRTSGPSASAVASGIVAVNLIAIPVALNVDSVAGLDSISVKLFFNDATHPKPVAVREGRAELFMFDGIPKPGQLPLRSWFFEVSDLAPYQFTASLGTGYELVLPWEKNQPTQRLVTVIARHVTSKGQVIQSAPSSINVYDPPASRLRTP